MQGLIGPLKELAEFEELCKNKKKDVGMIRVCGCVNSQKSHMMYALGDGCKYKVIACSSETKAKQIYEEYRFLDSNTYLYPAKDFLFYQADIRSKELVKQRMEGIQAVLSGEPVTVVTSLDGFMDHLAPKESIAEKVLKIQNDSVLKLDEMAEKLSVIGYDREVQVEGPGQFAVRGGILDIYPLTEELPVRIELWGDEVDSIRTFDVESQRSIENLMDIVIYPAVEFPQNGEKGVSFLDYFPPEDTILFLDEPVRLVERGQNIEDEFMEAQKKRLESGYDFSIEGNAFDTSSEPGVVWVMQDVNGNGEPDDEWYELRGSETGKEGTVSGYAVTYYRPAGRGMDVQWTDSEGRSGTVEYRGEFHDQDFYYPAWAADTYTLRGTLLESRNMVDDRGFWINRPYEWGYADNYGSDCLAGGDAMDGKGQSNGFRIANAMQPDGTPVELKYIDFVKVQVGVNAKSGPLGEVSTEVFSFADLSIAE